MPNTPAFIGRGVTALCSHHPEAVALATRLLDVVGEVVRLEDETLMDATTALSGSGPAYVFHMIEAMAAAGEAAGLDRQTSLQLSRATLAGAGLMAIQTKEEPSVLRSNVTSPNGTTAAGLAPLMDADGGLTRLMTQVIRAAAERSRELNAEIRAQMA